MSVHPEPILKALHYLFARSGERFAAHCLDLDLVASGKTMEDAEESLNAIVMAQVATCFTSGNFAQLRFSAPEESWEALKTAQHMETVHLEIEVPPVVLPVKRGEVATLQVYRALAEAAAA